MKGKNKEFNETQTPIGSLPEYLASYDSLAQHFRAQFDGLSTNEKGDKFATFGCRVIPQTEIGKEYNPPVLREKKTHDEGVDITASGKDGCSILYMRPQLAKRAAAFTGIQLIDGERSALQLLDDIYDRKIIYDETRLFYIGLFSKTPNNIFASNYTELMHDLIERFYKEDSYGEKTFQTLFALQAASQEGVKSAEERFIHPQYADLFKRLYSDNSLTYRCFIGILALCGAININIADRASDPTAEYERMVDFFSKALSLLENRKERFLRYYIMAVKTWMQEATPAEQEESEIRRDLYIKSKRFPFTGMYTKLCIEADMDTWLKEEEEAFQENRKQGK